MGVVIMRKYLFGICLLMASACTNDNEEELYPTNNCEVGTVTYALTVQPILEQNCYGCHATGIGSGNIILDTHPEASKPALNGHLMGAINHSPGFHPMPLGGSKLPACDIARIQAWVAAGAPNN